MDTQPESSRSTGPMSGDGEMCERSHPNRLMSGGATSSAEDSRAKMSVLLGQAEDWTATEVDCGLSTCESFASYDHGTSLWKTSQLCLFEGLGEFLGTWPKSGSMRNGKCFARPTLLCRTVENESLLLPTITKAMGRRGWGIPRTGRGRYSQHIIRNALRFGYKGPISLLEWMMGFPADHTKIE